MEEYMVSHQSVVYKSNAIAGLYQWHIVMMIRHSFIILFFSQLLVVSISQKSCQHGGNEGFMDYELLVQQALRIDPSSSTETAVTRIGRGLTYLLSCISITCSGNITGVLVGANIEIRTGNHDYPWIRLFNQVSFNTYTPVPGSERDIILGPDDFSTSGLYNYTFSSPIQFTSGNIIGVFQNSDALRNIELFRVKDYGACMIARIQPNEKQANYKNSVNRNLSPRYSRLLLRPIISKDSASTTNCLSGIIPLEDIKKLTRLVPSVSDGNYDEVAASGDGIYYKDIKFTCDGFITHVIAGLKDNSGQTSNPPEITIWRSSNGGNTYTQSGPTIPLYYSDAVSDISTDYLRWYNLSVPVPVKEGDVLGIYQHTPTADTDAVIYHQQFNGPYNYVGASSSTGYNYYPLISVIVTCNHPCVISTNSIDSSSSTAGYESGTTNVQPTSTISQQSPLKTWSQSPLFSIRTTVLATTDAKPVFKFSDPVVLSQTVIIITISCLLCFTIFAVVAVYCRKKRTSIQTSQCSGLANTVQANSNNINNQWEQNPKRRELVEIGDAPSNELSNYEVNEDDNQVKPEDDQYDYIAVSNNSIRPQSQLVSIETNLNDSYVKQENRPPAYIEGRKKPSSEIEENTYL